MHRLLFFIAGLFINPTFAQIYDVTIYEKIGFEIGGFGDGLDNEDWFGYAVEGIGDLNGDGINDVAA
ncbi:MAG TPA: hypothetical protein DC015_14135, partial [Aequorivita sp.]|nr:hypothetical protein [Aequorivita sp.]